MVEPSPSADIIEFSEKAEAFRASKAAEMLNQVRLVLAQLREDAQFIGLVQEMSLDRLGKSIGASGEHLAALESLAATLQDIAALLPPISESTDSDAFGAQKQQSPWDE